MERKHMIKLSFLILLFTVGLNYAQSLKILYCNRLYYQDDSVFKEIKRLGEKACFSGYEIINSEYVFLAYDKEGEAEASTIISVYNLKTNSEDYVGIIPVSGDAYFDYNQENNLVLFNNSKGLNVFNLSQALNFTQADFIQTQLILSGYYYQPFWIDSSNIGYKEWEENQWVNKSFVLKKE